MPAEVRSNPLGLVKGVVEGIMGVASKHLKKSGAFTFAGMIFMTIEGRAISDAGVREGALDLDEPVKVR